MDGYNSCIFAYGPSGSGKTFTLLGNNSEQGLISLYIDFLYQILSKRDESYLISLNVLEIYKDQLFDLLSKDKSKQQHLDIREDARGQTYVQNISSFQVTTPIELKNLIKNAINSRKISQTDLNQESSRSHILF